MEIDGRYVALERENEALRLTIKEDSVANGARISQLEADLARHQESCAVAVEGLESVLRDRQENYAGSGLDDARNALAILKRLR